MSDHSAPAWRVGLKVPVAAMPAVEAALETLGGALAVGGADDHGMVPIEVYLAAPPRRAHLSALLAAAALAAGIEAPEFTIERLPALDWVAESHRALPALHAGPFFVHGAHVGEPPPPGAIALRIEASAAFGTGHHESTRGCLMALGDLAAARRPVRRALDMGCGTGILAIAIAKLWRCPVVAVDSDADAVRLSAENARLNDVAEYLDVVQADGYGHRTVATGAPYDLIVANILAEPLCALAPDLRRHLAPDGVAVLSGLLADQAMQVSACHAPLKTVARVPLGDWVTLVLAADAHAPAPGR